TPPLVLGYTLDGSMFLSVQNGNENNEISCCGLPGGNQNVQGRFDVPTPSPMDPPCYFGTRENVLHDQNEPHHQINQGVHSVIPIPLSYDQLHPFALTEKWAKTLKMAAYQILRTRSLTLCLAMVERCGSRRKAEEASESGKYVCLVGVEMEGNRVKGE